MAATDKTWADGVPPQVNAVDLNGFKNENNNLIASTGLPVTPGDNAQTAEAVSDYAAGGGYFYQDSGAADSYILNAIGSRIQPKGYFTGMHVAFMPQNSNTGPSTVKVGILGTISLLSASGNPLIAEALAVGEYAKAFYDGSDFILIEHGTGSDLREQLASQVPGDDGARRVGLNDPNTGIGETIHDRFVRLSSKVFGADGAASIGLNDHTGQTDVNTFVNTQRPKDLQSSFALYGDDVGVADAIAVTLVPAYTTYVPGTRVYVKVANTNLTVTPTLNLNGLGFKNIIRSDGGVVDAGSLRSGGVYEFIYDGAEFQYLSLPAPVLVPGVFSQIDTVTHVNTSATNSLIGTIVGSNIIPANYLKVGDTYKFVGGGDYSLSTTSGLDEVFSFKINGVTLAQVVDVGRNHAAPMYFIITLTVRATGPTNNAYVRVEFYRGKAAPPDVFYHVEVVEVATADIDLSIINSFGIDFKFGTASAVNFITVSSLVSQKVFG